MPDKPAPKGKKLGPFSAVGWAAIGGGALVAFYLYKRYEAGTASTAAAGTLGGTSIPTGNVATTAPNAPVYSTWGEWEQAVISAVSGNNYSAGAERPAVLGERWVCLGPGVQRHR
jgi:hypothetical protein